MKTHILTAISISMLFSAPPSHALEPEQRPQPQKAPDARPDITIRATIVAVPNAEAIQFSAKQDLNGKLAEALNALEKLVAQKKASSVANFAVTTKSGQRALSGAGKVTLEVEAVTGDKGASINLAIDGSHQIQTSVQVSNGGVKFLGSVQSPTDKAMTDYIFALVSF